MVLCSVGEGNYMTNLVSKAHHLPLQFVCKGSYLFLLPRPTILSQGGGSHLL